MKSYVALQKQPELETNKSLVAKINIGSTTSWKSAKCIVEEYPVMMRSMLYS
ncbi:hypothetical protein N9Q19_01295 [Puniceicoccaceae bacterium]|nr:hypothetical protein [Puniceicoccaceae bacterium]